MHCGKLQCRSEGVSMLRHGKDRSVIFMGFKTNDCRMN